MTPPKNAGQKSDATQRWVHILPRSLREIEKSEPTQNRKVTSLKINVGQKSDATQRWVHILPRSLREIEKSEPTQNRKKVTSLKINVGQKSDATQRWVHILPRSLREIEKSEPTPNRESDVTQRLYLKKTRPWISIDRQTYCPSLSSRFWGGFAFLHFS